MQIFHEPTLMLMNAEKRVQQGFTTKYHGFILPPGLQTSISTRKVHLVLKK